MPKRNMSDRSMASHAKPNRYACTECSKRKIRCDRALPCSHCHKTNLKCRYVDPPPPRRKVALSKSKDQATRLAGLERLVERLQHDGKKAHTHERHTIPPDGENVCKGLLVGEGQGKSRYLEMPVMISLSETINNTNPEDDENDSETSLHVNNSIPESFLYQGLIFGHHEQLDLRHTRPHAAHRQYLWQTFLRNCHPILKIFDPGATARIVSQASNGKRHTAFLMALYSLAILSMEDMECKAVMGVPKEALLQTFHRVTEHALAAIDVLATTDTMLFIQAQTDHSKLWSLTGLAVRIAQRMGLHRDGASLGLGVTDTELRRRLWWQLVLLDTCTAEQTGSRGMLNGSGWDTRMPSFSSIETVAAPDTEPSPKDNDMVYSLVRFEIFNFLRTATKHRSTTGRQSCGGSGVPFLFDSTIPRAEREGVLDSLEGVIRSKYLSGAQLLDSPMQQLACSLARLVTARLRLLVIYPRRDMTTGDEEEDSGQRERLLHLCTRCLDIDAHVHSAPELTPFRWHLRRHFPWAAFLGLLVELLRRGRQSLSCCSDSSSSGGAEERTDRTEEDRAWRFVGEVYELHPDFLNDRGVMLHRSAARLVLMAWRARWKKGVSCSGVAAPEYIQILQRVYGLVDPPRYGPDEVGDRNGGLPSNEESIWLTQHDMLAHLCGDVDGLWAGNMFTPTCLDESFLEVNESFIV